MIVLRRLASDFVRTARASGLAQSLIALLAPLVWGLEQRGELPANAIIVSDHASYIDGRPLANAILKQAGLPKVF
jgi:hypothetical protein